eukprot:UN25914
MVEVSDERNNVLIKDSDFEFKPRAIQYDAKKNELFIGSKTNQIARYKFDNGGEFSLFVDGHDGQVWGLCTHPSEPIYCTGGYDNVLKIWNAETLQLISTYEFELEDNEDLREIVTAHWSDDGKYICVGTEQSEIAVFAFEDGHARLLAKELIPKKNKNAELEAVSYIRFSPDSTEIAVAHMDAQGYIFDMEFSEDGKLTLKKWKPMVMSTAPSNLQWGKDKGYIKFLTRDYEVVHFRLDHTTKKGRFHPGVPNPDVVPWAGDPLICGWDVQGLYQKGWDGTDLNDASLSHDNKFIA